MMRGECQQVAVGHPRSVRVSGWRRLLVGHIEFAGRDVSLTVQTISPSHCVRSRLARQAISRACWLDCRRSALMPNNRRYQIEDPPLTVCHELGLRWAGTQGVAQNVAFWTLW